MVCAGMSYCGMLFYIICVYCLMPVFVRLTIKEQVYCFRNASYSSVFLADQRLVSADKYLDGPKHLPEP